MTSGVDLVMLVLFVLGPLLTARDLHDGLKRAIEAGISGARRLEYRRSIAMYWMFAAVAAAAAFDGGRSLEELHLAPPEGIGLIISAAAIVAVFGYMTLQARSLNTPEASAAARTMLAPMAWYVPNDAADLKVFRQVALSAGICEEWMFRGYLLAVLQPWLGTAGAIAGSTLLFGAGHLYQGGGGVVKTGVIGLLMALLTWATGSIWAPIVIHALFDWMQGDMIARVLGSEPAASTSAQRARNYLRFS